MLLDLWDHFFLSKFDQCTVYFVDDSVGRKYRRVEVILGGSSVDENDTMLQTLYFRHPVSDTLIQTLCFKSRVLDSLFQTHYFRRSVSDAPFQTLLQTLCFRRLIPDTVSSTVFHTESVTHRVSWDSYVRNISFSLPTLKTITTQLTKHLFPTMCLTNSLH